MAERGVVLVPTGTANQASVAAGLVRAGGHVTVAADAAEVRDAGRVVLPGVGAFGASMESLDARGFADALRERVAAGRPLLAICVGFQLLFEESEESPGARGLGLFAGTVRRFPSGRVPQLGWNRVEPDAGSRLVRPGYAYFANSYRVSDDAPGCAAARTDYGGPFVSAIERGALLGCQFHPELSGRWGRELLERWVALGEELFPC